MNTQLAITVYILFAYVFVWATFYAALAKRTIDSSHRTALFLTGIWPITIVPIAWGMYIYMERKIDRKKSCIPKARAKEGK